MDARGGLEQHLFGRIIKTAVMLILFIGTSDFCVAEDSTTAVALQIDAGNMLKSMVENDLDAVVRLELIAPVPEVSRCYGPRFPENGDVEVEYVRTEKGEAGPRTAIALLSRLKNARYYRQRRSQLIGRINIVLSMGQSLSFHVGGYPNIVAYRDSFYVLGDECDFPGIVGAWNLHQVLGDAVVVASELHPEKESAEMFCPLHRDTEPKLREAASRALEALVETEEYATVRVEMNSPSSAAGRVVGEVTKYTGRTLAIAALEQLRRADYAPNLRSRETDQMVSIAGSSFRVSFKVGKVPNSIVYAGKPYMLANVASLALFLADSWGGASQIHRAPSSTTRRHSSDPPGTQSSAASGSL